MSRLDPSYFFTATAVFTAKLIWDKKMFICLTVSAAAAAVRL